MSDAPETMPAQGHAVPAPSPASDGAPAPAADTGDILADGGASALESTPRSPRRRWRVPPVVRGLVLYAVLALLLGVVAALVWHAVVRLPHYTLDKNHIANTTERGLTKFFTTDAWYCLLGLLGGAVIGISSWWLFRRLGAWVTLIALVAAGLAGLVTWHLGQAMGPNHFSSRISSARAGQDVPIDFRLHSHAALLVWLVAADLPVLLFSSLLHDADDEGSARRRWRLRRRRPEHPAPEVEQAPTQA